MRKSSNLRSMMAQKTVLLIGGCHGTCLFHASDEEAARRGRRQFLLANCIVLTLCAAIAAAVVTIAWV